MALTMSEAKAKFSEIVNRAAYGRERIVVGARGKANVAIISIEDLELLEDLEDAQEAREGLEEYRRGETISWEEAKAQLARGDDELQDRDPSKGFEIAGADSEQGSGQNRTRDRVPGR